MIRAIRYRSFEFYLIPMGSEQRRMGYPIKIHINVRIECDKYIYITRLELRSML